ncbi:MAG: hypothetical protein ACRD2N_13825 [Vicinamibacterales bacterium]
MEVNKLVFAGLTASVLAAAAGGAYVAVRNNQTPPAGAGATAIATPADPAASQPGTAAPVTESEGVIAPDRSSPPAAPPRRVPTVTSAPAASARASASRPASNGSVARSQPTMSDRDSERPALSQRPSSVASSAPASSGGSMWETRAPVQASAPEYREAEPPPPPPPPAPEFMDLTVPADAVLGLQVERTVSSELARVEDRVEARVTRDVRVNDRIAIPAGATVRGSVTEVDRGGKVSGRARLAIRFHTIVLADGTQLALKTDPVVREGESNGKESAAKIGGATVGGAILGAILGGSKGAAIGAGVGAGAGGAAVMANDRNPATILAGSTVTVRMQAPVTVTVSKE